MDKFLVIPDVYPIIIHFSMSMKAPFIVNEAKEALESGYSVVIGLQTTGEVPCNLPKTCFHGGNI